MSGWGCVHEDHGKCNRVAGRPCDPGMKGCILAGRFRFSNPAKNRPVKSLSENTHDSAPNDDGSTSDME